MLGKKPQFGRDLGRHKALHVCACSICGRPTDRFEPKSFRPLDRRNLCLASLSWDGVVVLDMAEGPNRPGLAVNPKTSLAMETPGFICEGYIKLCVHLVA